MSLGKRFPYANLVSVVLVSALGDILTLNFFCENLCFHMLSLPFSKVEQHFNAQVFLKKSKTVEQQNKIKQALPFNFMQIRMTKEELAHLGSASICCIIELMTTVEYIWISEVRYNKIRDISMIEHILGRS